MPLKVKCFHIESDPENPTDPCKTELKIQDWLDTLPQNTTTITGVAMTRVWEGGWKTKIIITYKTLI